MKMLGFLSLGLLLAGGLSCTPLGSSFETLGIPHAETIPGKGAVVIGWAHDARDGWSVERVRVGKRLQRRWDAEGQTPSVLHLPPGEHSLRLYAKQYSDSGEPRRRVRTRPIYLELVEEEVQLCVITLGERGPRGSCSHYLGPRARRSVVVEAQPENASRSRRPREAQASSIGNEAHGDDVIERILAKLETIERRLDELTAVPVKSSQKRTNAGTALVLDTEFPGSNKRKSTRRRPYRFDSSFDEDDTGRMRPPYKTR